jgi:Domain of unknown function (DUF4169)
MGQIVNLRVARKRAKRRQSEQEAAANRLALGRSKAVRNMERAKSEKAEKDLERHRINRGNEP